MTPMPPLPGSLPIPPTDLFTIADLLGPDGDRAPVRRALDRGELVRVCRDVYARSHPDDPVERHL